MDNWQKNFARFGCLCFSARRGAESIGRSFPLLTLEEIYGAIAFYLANQTEIDAYLTWEEIETEQAHQLSRQSHAVWYEKMRKVKQETLVPQICFLPR